MKSFVCSVCGGDESAQGNNVMFDMCVKCGWSPAVWQAHVHLLCHKYKDTWRDRTWTYWFSRLVSEIGELALALEHEHEHPADLELMEIVSICQNWLRMRECGRQAILDIKYEQRENQEG